MSVASIALLLGCTPPREPKKLEMEPIGTIKNVPTTPREEVGDSATTTPNSGTPTPGATPCSGTEIDNLEESLAQCEVAMPRASDVPSVKDKLDVQVTTSRPTTPPGGRVEVSIVLRNKSSEPLTLYFTGDPRPRFDVEAVDARGRRADLPSTKWPGFPKGYKPEARDAKAARVTLEKGGSARIKLAWDAVKARWAPEKARSWEGRGYPRVPSGPIAPGRYTLRAILPMLGDADIPKVSVDVEKPS